MPRLRHNSRRFKESAVDSLVLAIELFNRPQDRGRVDSVLLLLQHAFEMLIKGKIWQERGTITETGSRISHRFDKCLRIARDDLNVIDSDGFTALTMLSELRDCAAHNLVQLSEDAFYLHVQAGVTLFADLLRACFGEDLAEFLPNRVMPVSKNPPTDIALFLDREFAEIRSLLAPGRRQQSEAHAKLRPMLIMEAALADMAQQPTTNEVARAAYRLKRGEDWRNIFRGVASLRLDTTGSGLTFSVKFTRDPGAAPVRLLRPGEEAADAAPIREVNVLDRYSMGLKDVAEKLGLSQPKTLALVRHLGLQADEDCFREITVGKNTFKRYTPKALEALRKSVATLDIEQVWREHRPARRRGL